MTSLEELAAIPSDIVVLAVTGIAGLWAAVATLKRGGTLAIANKETIVCAGRHLKALEKNTAEKFFRSIRNIPLFSLACAAKTRSS